MLDTTYTQTNTNNANKTCGKVCVTKTKYIMYNAQDCSVLYNIAVRPVFFVRVGNLFTGRKDLHDRIISPRGGIWVHKTRLHLPIFIEVPLPSQ